MSNYLHCVVQDLLPKVNTQGDVESLGKLFSGHIGRLVGRGHFAPCHFRATIVESDVARRNPLAVCIDEIVNDTLAGLVHACTKKCRLAF